MKWINLVLIWLLFFTILDASDAKVEKVIVTGMGIDKEKAMKNASQTAIQQVIGSYVVSDSLVANGKLIKDEVLSYSNGFITKFTTIKEGKNEDDLYEIQAEVIVEAGKLTQKLGQLNIAMKNVATNEFKVKSMYAFDSKKDFRTLADEIIYRPMRENAKIYDIQILGFEPSEYYDKHMRTTIYKDGLVRQIKLGELLPFKLSFTMKLNNSYITSVKSFLEKSSELTYENLVDYQKILDSGNERFIIFGKIDASLTGELKDNFKMTKAYQISSANGNIMDVLSSDQNLSPIVIVDLLDESNDKIKSYAYGYTGYESFYALSPQGGYDYNTPSLFLNDSYYGNSIEFFVGLPLKMRSRRFLFSVNEFPINALFFLTKDEASKVKNIKIEVNMGPWRR